MPANQGVQLTPLARPVGWARSTRLMRYGLLATQKCATSTRFRRPQMLGVLSVGRTHIAWQLPPADVLHASDARQRRS